MTKAKLKKLPCPTEDAEQKNLITWAEVAASRYPELRLLYHVPNSGGGPQHINYSRKLKAMGLKSGVPDLVLPVARQGFHGLYLELKRRAGGDVSEAQRRWHFELRQEDYRVEVCRGADAARDVLIDYLTKPEAPWLTPG